MKRLGRTNASNDEARRCSFCPSCHQPVSLGEFTKKEALRTYKRTGKCQKCQDKGR